MAICSEECRLQNFGFRGVSNEVFYRSQCSKNRYCFFVYRSILFIYCFSWMAYNWSTKDPNYPLYLTSWGEMVVNVYYLLYFVVLLSAIIKNSYCMANNSERVEEMEEGEEDELLAHDEDENAQKEDTSIPSWYLCIIWVFMEVAAVVSLGISLLYWTVDAKNTDEDHLFSASNLHRHLILAIFMIVDVMVIAIPVRLLHFYHPMLFGLVYSLFSFLTYLIAPETSVYVAIDWGNNAKLAIILSFGSTFVIVPILFLLFYGLYRLKLAVVGCCDNDNLMKMCCDLDDE